MHGRCENITNPACLACALPIKGGGFAEVEVSKRRSSQPALLPSLSLWRLGSTGAVVVLMVRADVQQMTPVWFLSPGPHSDTASGCQNLQCGFRACCRSGEWPPPHLSPLPATRAALRQPSRLLVVCTLSWKCRLLYFVSINKRNKKKKISLWKKPNSLPLFPI